MMMKQMLCISNWVMRRLKELLKERYSKDRITGNNITRVIFAQDRFHRIHTLTIKKQGIRINDVNKKMVKKTVYLPDELHDKLKHIATELHCSVNDLLRTAAEEVYWENIEDVKLAETAWNEHKKDPHHAVDAREFFSKQKIKKCTKSA